MDSKKAVILQEIKCVHKQLSTDNREETIEPDIREKAKNLDSAVASHNYSGALKECYNLSQLLMEQRLLSEQRAGARVQIYVTETRFLWECFQYLRRFHSEAVHFVTGPEVNGIIYLTSLIPIKMSHRSWGSADVDLSHTHKILQDLEEFGHRLTGYFHTHPGRGAGATHPSGTDLSMQMGLERAGYPTIGGIFSKDRYVRFFSYEKEFTIMVYEKKIRAEGNNVFQLVP